MTTTPQEFKELASELKSEFKDFFVSRAFYKAGDINPVTGAETGSLNENIECLREEYNQNQIDGQQIQSNDFMLLVLVDDIPLGFNVNTDDLKVTVDNTESVVISAKIDPANAVWTLQVRG